jgi:hypothetical protein
LVLCDVTTLWFETDSGDGFREPGFAKERRLESQIAVGLLTDSSGAPLMVEGFEGDKAETRMMIPVVRSFAEAHGIVDVTTKAAKAEKAVADQAPIKRNRFITLTTHPRKVHQLPGD